MKLLTMLLGLLAVACSKTTSPGVLHSDTEINLYSQGGEKDNGADTIEEGKGSAWFTGSEGRYITTCVEISADFGVSSEVISKAIVEASYAWMRYFEDKAIPTEVRLLDPWAGDRKCSGNEDVIFYFGSRNSAVDEAIKKFNQPVGFAYRESADFTKGWSKGFIWIAPHGEYTKGRSAYPNWQEKYNLKGLIMHELGHVYGVGHVPLTIMDERLSEFLQGQENERATRLGKIDSYRDLYACMGCPISKHGDLGFKGTEVENFTQLVGRAPVGPPVARVEGTLSKNLLLRIDDFHGTEDFQIEFSDAGTDQSGVNGQGDLQRIFRVAKMNSDGKVEVTAISHGARVLYGRIQTKSNGWMPIAFEVNLMTEVLMASGLVHLDGLVIKTFNEGLPRILFYSVAY